MFSWGERCKLVLGAYGGFTCDRPSGEYVYACESWTDDRLPYSCTALRSLPPFRPTPDIRVPCTASDVDGQIIYYRKSNPDSYIPEDILTEYCRDTTDSLPRHSVMCCVAGGGGDGIVLVHPSGPNHGTINFTPIEFDDGRLLAMWAGRRRHKLPSGRIRKISSRGDGIAALTSTFSIHLFNSRTFQTLHCSISPGEEVHDLGMAEAGSSVLYSGESGCALYDIEQRTGKRRWKTAAPPKHCSVLAEYTFTAASTNSVLLMDSRASDRHVVFPFALGGEPLSLCTGHYTNTLLYVSGTDRLIAADLRSPKTPILQWMHDEFFGSRLAMVSAVDTGRQADLLVGVTCGKEELLSVPVVPNSRLNTITSLTPSMLSSLNYNRLFAKLSDPQPIVGQAWIRLSTDDHCSFHMTADGQIGYQHHSFSGKFRGAPVETAQDLAAASIIIDSGCVCRPVPEKRHACADYSELLRACTEKDVRRRYVEVNGAQRDALKSWHVPARSGRYIPRLLGTALTLREEAEQAGRVRTIDRTLLSTAARILHKQWNTK